MQQNIYPYVNQHPTQQFPVQGPNAVNINIIQPQAYASGANANCPNANCSNTGVTYPLYQTNPNPSLPLYPMNYNNMFPQQSMNKNDTDGLNAFSQTNLKTKTENSKNEEITKTEEKKDDKKAKKKITILTDDYIKSLENYFNDSNPKVRLMAAKELLERFKEDDSRAENPCLVPLLNKALRDTSPSVRFLGLTMLQLGYSLGDDETVQILKEIQSTNKDKLGEDALLASEILLKLSAPKMTEV